MKPVSNPCPPTIQKTTSAIFLIRGYKEAALPELVEESPGCVFVEGTFKKCGVPCCSLQTTDKEYSRKRHTHLLVGLFEGLELSSPAGSSA